MTKVGILAGGGKLPISIGKSLLHSNYDVIFFCIKNFCNPKLYKDYVFENISINSRQDKPNIFRLAYTNKEQRKVCNQVKKKYTLCEGIEKMLIVFVIIFV